MKRKSLRHSVGEFDSHALLIKKDKVLAASCLAPLGTRVKIGARESDKISFNKMLSSESLILGVSFEPAEMLVCGIGVGSITDVDEIPLLTIGSDFIVFVQLFFLEG